METVYLHAYIEMRSDPGIDMVVGSSLEFWRIPGYLLLLILHQKVLLKVASVFETSCGKQAKHASSTEVETKPVYLITKINEINASQASTC